MPFIQVDIAKSLSPDQLARMREDIVDAVHVAIGSARGHINVVIREHPSQNVVEAGKTPAAAQAVASV
jgi:phenylpyruvate tautomerase PptA (4-oxalocrotonate tautomerase family)